MAGTVLNKVWDLFGLGDEVEEIDETEEMNDMESNEIEPVIMTSKKQNKVVNIHTAVSAKVVILKPKSYDEATDICDNLKNRKIVVVNTNDLEPKIAQRLIDFIGGACYALSGEIQDLEKGIFILSPSNVEVDNEFKSELSGKGMFTWSK